MGHVAVHALGEFLGVELGSNPLPHDLVLHHLAGAVRLTLSSTAYLPETSPFTSEPLHFLVLPPHPFCDCLTLCLFFTTLALNVDLLILGTEAIELALEVKIPLLLLLVLQEPAFCFLLLLDDAVPPLLHFARRLLLLLLPPHHRHVRFLGSLLLHEGLILSQTLLAQLVLLLLLFESRPSQTLNLHVVFNALVDPEVAHFFLLPHCLLELHLLLLHEIRSLQILCTHFFLSGLLIAIRCFARLCLLFLDLFLPHHLVQLPLISLFLLLRFDLSLLFELLLLLHELLLGNLLLKLLPSLSFHGLSLLLLRSLVIELLETLGSHSCFLRITISFLLKPLIVSLYRLQRLQLVPQGILKPIPFVLLCPQELVSLQFEAVTVQC
mmetsp:Transcript_71890/g.131632  ORF Transcript_71890/g.131632 Transcript_71890/m.131632 type:complete len:381 (+) Transcript_71890:248-1390(+)